MPIKVAVFLIIMAIIVISEVYMLIFIRKAEKEQDKLIQNILEKEGNTDD